MNDECCNQRSSPSLSRYSHSEVKLSGLEREARSRVGGGQVNAEDLLKNL